MMELIEAYTSGKAMAKDICFAMALAPGTRDVRATYVQGFGWHVDCWGDAGARDRVRVILGRKADKVNWL